MHEQVGRWQEAMSLMVRMYSRRLLCPYVGVIQVAGLNHVHALSLDGENRAFCYALSE